MSRGERAIGRLLQEAAAAGIAVKTVGLRRADILHYLDDEVCQQAAPGFPEWEAAIASAGSRKWKRWVTARYGLSLTRDNIRTLAAECRRLGKVPAEIGAIIEELAAYAAEPGP